MGIMIFTEAEYLSGRDPAASLEIARDGFLIYMLAQTGSAYYHATWRNTQQEGIYAR